MIRVIVMDCQKKTFDGKSYFKVAVRLPEGGIGFINVYRNEFDIDLGEDLELVPYITKNHTIALKVADF